METTQITLIGAPDTRKVNWGCFTSNSDHQKILEAVVNQCIHDDVFLWKTWITGEALLACIAYNRALHQSEEALHIASKEKAAEVEHALTILTKDGWLDTKEEQQESGTYVMYRISCSLMKELEPWMTQKPTQDHH